MIVRTYGRRNRGLTRTYSDSFNTDDDVSDDPFGDSFSLSQDTPQDLYSFPFPSSQDQESSSFWSSQENNSVPTLAPPPRPNFSNSESGVVCKSKKQKKEGYFGQLIPPTSTLMEAQEFGEMMEHVDEVNFAIDGLKKGSQVRIRRASLLSLLSICGTAQQRRLLRTEGYVGFQQLLFWISQSFHFYFISVDVWKYVISFFKKKNSLLGFRSWVDL